MKTTTTLALVTALLLTGTALTRAESYSPPEVSYVSETKDAKLTQSELRTLVAPIALYPDALIAQVPPASTFPNQIADAYRFRQTASDPRTPPSDSNWDSSVVALLNYPTVLKKLNDDPAWTDSLGEAVSEQMGDVTDAIQTVRAEAQSAGNLTTNDQQIVRTEDRVIQIVPANPEVIYVPSYDPVQVLYAYDPYYYDYPLVSFGIGYPIGFWFDGFMDWRHHHIWHNHYWRSGRWHRGDRFAWTARPWNFSRGNFARWNNTRSGFTSGTRFTNRNSNRFVNNQTTTRFSDRRTQATPTRNFNTSHTQNRTWNNQTNSGTRTFTQHRQPSAQNFTSHPIQHHFTQPRVTQPQTHLNHSAPSRSTSTLQYHSGSGRMQSSQNSSSHRRR